MALRSRSQTVQVDTQLLAGIQKHYPTTTFATPGGPITAAQVTDAVNGRNLTAQAAVTAKTAFHAAVAADEQEVEKTDDLLNGVRQSILGMYPTPDVLSDCGVAPRKSRRTLTTAEKAIAAARAKATRQARGTKGARQKASIVGTVAPGTVVVQIGSPPAQPASTAASASTSTNGTSTPHA